MIIAAYVTAMVLGGIVIWLVDPRDYPDPWLAFWYVLQTITTVGYGDATPTDPVGRAVGAVIMLVSIATLSILTAFITSAFVEARQAERRAQIGRRRGRQSSTPRSEAQRPGGPARADRTTGAAAVVSVPRALAFRPRAVGEDPAR